MAAKKRVKQKTPNLGRIFCFGHVRNKYLNVPYIVLCVFFIIFFCFFISAETKKTKTPPSHSPHKHTYFHQMSTAVFPLGMRHSMPASGYNHASAHWAKQYVSWKGQPLLGSAPGHIRPLTNNDTGNVFPTGFGLPRPIKHFRKGRMLVVSNPETAPMINYNINRYVGTSKGEQLLRSMQDTPGGVTMSTSTTSLPNECCQGISVVSSYVPNPSYLTDNPEPVSESPLLCCNQAAFAKRRVIYASSNLNKNYFSSTRQYLQNRCKTFEQKSFHFVPTTTSLDATTFLSNCQPTSVGNANCYRETVYKPNNAQFAQQGAVSSSTRLLKLNVDTITTNAGSLYEIRNGLKQKTNEVYCEYPLNMRPRFPNKQTCCYGTDSNAPKYEVTTF